MWGKLFIERFPTAKPEFHSSRLSFNNMTRLALATVETLQSRQSLPDVGEINNCQYPTSIHRPNL
jgi:hypothetical protein